MSHNHNDAGVWTVIIADDDESVHAVTELFFNKFTYKNKKIKTISAFNYDETVDCIEKNSDAAVLLLDVVMDTDDSGIRVIKYIREVCKNQLIRIILRTGHPGLAPEHKMIKEYDIHDYKNKTELSSEKFHTAIVSALRTYESLLAAEKIKLSLLAIFDSEWQLSNFEYPEQFLSFILNRLSASLNLRDSFLFIQNFNAKRVPLSSYSAGTGLYSQLKEKTVSEIITQDVKECIQDILVDKRNILNPDEFFSTIEGKGDSSTVLYLCSSDLLGEENSSILELFAHNVLSAFNCLNLQHEMEKSAREKENKLRSLTNYLTSVIDHVLFHENVVSSLHEELVHYYSKTQKITERVSLHAIIAFHLIPVIEIIKAEDSPHNLVVNNEIFKKELNALKAVAESVESSNLQAAIDILSEIYEKWDGTGSPYRLEGEEISISSRVLGFTKAMVNYYNENNNNPDSIRQFISKAKSEFKGAYDPSLIEATEHSFEKIRQIFHNNL